MQGLPWGALTEFMGFHDVLNLRLVCREWNLGLTEGVSVEWCRSNISAILKKQNSFAFEASSGNLQTSWQIGATQENLNDLLLLQGGQDNMNPKNPSVRSCFDQLVKILRVVQNLPKSIVVAFSSDYGRHCRPVQYDKHSNTSKMRPWDACKRHDCRTCKIPVIGKPKFAKKDDSVIGEWAILQGRHGPINMTDYLPICIPNLPADMICPNCHIHDHRTLVLSEFSYRATHPFPSHRPAHAHLVWTPNVDNTTSNGQENQEEGESRSAKRSKTEGSRRISESQFPPRYAEMALPMQSEPIPLPMDAKFCIAIHCTACEEFAIWAPASVCRHSDFVCHERGREIRSDNMTIGGALVRTQCSLPDCNQAIACPHCAHQVWHEPYSSYGGERQVRRVSHCDTCRETYCSEHAWVSTVCHHW